jgi:serine/threonine-protein kinase
VKVIAPELAVDPAFRKRFEREAKAAASVEHPGVLPVYEAGVQDGVLFVATRYAAGGDLRRALAEHGPADPEVAVEIAGQVADALDAAHARGLLHRDVKTANILLEGDLGRNVRAYLADFGLVRRTATQTQAATGSWLGSVDYVAPEQLKGDDVDVRADVYSLGCVLFELLTGHPPYRRASDVATLWAHIAEPPPPLPSHLGHAAALDAVLARALVKDPGIASPARAPWPPPPEQPLTTAPQHCRRSVRPIVRQRQRGRRTGFRRWPTSSWCPSWAWCSRSGRTT